MSHSPVKSRSSQSVAAASRLQRLARLLAVGVVLGAGGGVLWQVAAAARTFNVPAARPGGGPDALPSRLVPDSPWAHWLSGQWTVAGSPWSTEVAEVSRDALPARMAEPPELTPAFAASLADWPELLPLLNELLPGPLCQGPLRIYERRGDDWQLAVFVHVGPNDERLLGARVAYPRDADAWTLTTLVCRGTASEQRLAGPSLLPGLALEQRLCARWNPEGRLQCELLRVERSRLDGLLSHWRRAGWDVRSDAGAGGAGRYLCYRDGETIHASVRPRPWLDRDTLVLVRVEDVLTAFPTSRQGTD